ncbi:MAG: type II toxin-antitoxin system prevent-host-death family antitoxin [Deltaproteobacteria bacterium]|nr:type II toxin-antitoxin system prevent-host-death family antitoxin [Deltaproteobacteria bacterium]MBW2137894.1 type II toxin-antitoxin system prevent-host-death family antitoxin [Deltaproteobacteria bacterium]
MTKVGAYEAKTRLSELLEKVARGDRIVITKHGRPVAVLSPASTQASPGEVVAQIKAFRQGRRLKRLRIREIIEEGRR